MRKLDKLWFLAAILLGLNIGQLTAGIALDPGQMLNRAQFLAMNAYYLGCVQAHGALCKPMAKLYYDNIRSIRLVK